MDAGSVFNALIFFLGVFIVTSVGAAIAYLMEKFSSKRD